MAKIKISELAKELGCEGKEIVSYLQEQGVEAAKRSTSSIEEVDAEKARKRFGGRQGKGAAAETAAGTEKKAAEQAQPEKKSAEQTQPEKKPAIKAPEKAAPAAKEIPETAKAEAPAALKDAAVKKAPPKAEKPAAETDAPVQEAGKAAAKPAAAGQKPPAPGARPMKKRRTIIVVSNPNNSRANGAPGDRRGGQRPGGRSTFAQSQNAYRPIKPLTAPSQMESYDRPKPVQPTPKKAAAPAPQKTAPEQSAPQDVRQTPQEAQQPEKIAEKPVQSAAAATEKPAKAAERASVQTPEAKRPADRTRPARPARPGEGTRTRIIMADRTDAGQGRGGRPGTNVRGKTGPDAGRPGPNGRRGKEFDGKSGDKRQDDRRRQGQERDRRGRKDFTAYQDEELLPRSKRVGRFIKPEVKKEEPEEQIKTISVPEKITIKELADKMRIQPSVIIKKLFLSGQIVTVNSELSYEEAENIAIEYDIICEKEVPVDIIEELLKEDEDDPATLVKRPPVVAVMGHVDHGKTSLLDAIRNTNVIDREAGGITQKIGAYTVTVKGQTITFLDTPGHEAFTAMRMRGANSTDIAVLVVAADDGVMPQTVEAINHAKAAGIEIIVAVNKIDKPGANVDRVKQELTEHELIATDWGGSTEFVPVSAKTGEGIETLLETILLTADIMEIKANPNRLARGIVLEAELDKGRGPVANVLVQKGTLHVGDFISAGASHGKVRAMVNDKGRRVKEAKPSEPVEILGLSDVPGAGEVFPGHASDKEAKQYAGTYLQQHKKDLIDETRTKMSLDDLYSKIEEGKLKELNIIIKADVQGSVEALKQSLLKLSNDEVAVKVIHGGVGAINESDVTLAATSSAIIIGFDVRPDSTAKSLAEQEGVEIKLYKVIYQAIDDVEAALKGMLAPVYEEKVTGHLQIRQIFRSSAIGNIAGAFVLDGTVQKDSKVRIFRGEEQIFEGALASLKRFKDDVKEVREGYECGLVFDGFDQMQVDDTVEAYIMVEVPRE